MFSDYMRDLNTSGRRVCSKKSVSLPEQVAGTTK